MKGGGLSYTLPAKRRWRGLVIAMLGLVLLSMLVPLVFLLGLHNGVHSDAGYPSGQNKPSSYGVRISLQHEVESTRTQLRQHNAGNNSNQTKGDRSKHVDGLLQRFAPTLPKDFRKVYVKEEATHKIKGSPVLKNFSGPPQKENGSIKVNVKEATHKVKGIVSSPGVTNFSRPPPKANDSTKVYVKETTHKVRSIISSPVSSNFSGPPQKENDSTIIYVKEATHKVKGSPVSTHFLGSPQKANDSTKVYVKEATHKVKGSPVLTNFSRPPQKANDSTKAYVEEATHKVNGSPILTNSSGPPQKKNESTKVNVMEATLKVKGSPTLINFSGPPQKANDSTKVYVKEATHNVKGSNALTNFSRPPQKTNDSIKVNVKEAIHKVKGIISSHVLTNFSGSPQKTNDSTKVYVKEATHKVNGSSVLTNFSGPPQKDNDSMKVNVKATHKVKDIISSSVLTNFSGPPQKANDSTKVYMKEATHKVNGSSVLTNFSGRPQMDNDSMKVNVNEATHKVKDIISSSMLTNFSGPPQKANDSTKVVKEATLKVKGSPVLTNFSGPSQKENGTRLNGSPVVRHMEDVKDENESLCEMKFGSYCLWRQQRAQKMNDGLVKRMKDQLFMARAYYPSITKLPAHDKLSQELKQNIQEFERVLSETTTDSDLPRQMKGKLGKMEAVMARAKSIVPMKSINVEKKFRQLVDLTEDEASFHMKQSAFLYQLAVQTMAKSLHCLSMRLTTEYFRSPPPNLDKLLAKKYTNPTLHHYVIFSNNVLASSVVINSTVMHSKVSKNQVFHILTDRQNYFAMKLWFNKYNNYMEATVRVLNFEDPGLIRRNLSTPLSLSLPEEFRITFNGIDKSKTSARTEYISMFSHSHYLLPEIFHPLKKVVVLDDDIVVQRDLSGLWSLNLKGKVNGAVQFCAVRFSQLKSYLGDNIKDGTACSWMSGLNIVDLDRWRKQDLTAKFQKLLKEPNKEGNLYPSPTLRASLLAFEGLFHPLNKTLVVSGLGHYYSLDMKVIKEASVLHYNGNMKPWIDMGIPKYRTFWRKFVDSENQLLNDCNVNS